MPPSAARVPSTLRMSTSTLASPDFSSCDTVGSVVMPASIRPCRIAAIKLLSAPTGSTVYCERGTPLRLARYCVRKLVEEPSPVTPSVLPFTSAMLLIEPAALVATISTSPGTWPNTTIALTSLPLACRSIV